MQVAEVIVPVHQRRSTGVHRRSPARQVEPALLAILALAGALMLSGVTRSGYGNSYYAAGALAASHSWSAMLTNAADLGGYVSLDKGPLPDWLAGMSGRLFGFGSFSVMFPNALYGLATVAVLYDTVRRGLGHPTAIIAALVMALTPVAVLVARYNAPDALLLFLLVCAAWSLTVSVQSGRRRGLLLCALFVGLAFNTKMLEAYLVVPGLALAYLVAGQRPLRRRLGELVLAAGVMLLVSFAWFASMALVPAGDRPYVGESSGNSWFQLILGGNGIERVTGSPGAFARHIDSNLVYLFSHHVAGQIAWLLPLALVGLVLGLFSTRSPGRGGLACGSYVLWGTWLIIASAVLSVSAGTRHAYYTSLLAPAVATLAAAALVTMWRLARDSRLAAAGLALALLGSCAVSFVVLTGTSDFLPWLRWLVLACGGVSAAGVIAPHRRDDARGRATLALALGVGTLALLAGPGAFSIATAARAHTGYDPLAGPAPAGHAADVSSPELTSAQSLAILTPYLQRHRDHARVLVAASDAKTADPIALATRRPVITLGGFDGSDPTPTSEQLKQLLSSRQLRYVVLDASRVQPATRALRERSASTWVQRNCMRVRFASRPSKLALFDCG